MRFQNTLLSCVALAVFCLPLADCSKKVVENHYVAPVGDVHQQQRNMHVVYSTVYHKNVVEYQDNSGAWLVAGMMIGGAWSPWYYPYSYWNQGYYNGWASQNQTNITYNNFGSSSAGTPVANGSADVDATASGDPDSVVGTAAPSDEDYSNQGDVNVAPSSDDNSADGTPAATNSSEDDGTPAATTSSQSEDDGTPAATTSSQSEDDGTPAATTSSQSEDDGTPAATASSPSDDDNSSAASPESSDDSGSSMGNSDSSDSGSGSDDSSSSSSSGGDDE